MKETIGFRFKRAWNIFMNRDPTYWNNVNTYGQSSGYRPDRTRMTKGRERSIITAICNRIALDAFREASCRKLRGFIQNAGILCNCCIAISYNHVLGYGYISW